MFALATPPVATLAFGGAPFVFNTALARLYYEHSKDIFIGVKLNAFRPWHKKVIEIQPKELRPVDVPGLAGRSHDFLFKSTITGEYVMIGVDQLKGNFYRQKLIQV